MSPADLTDPPEPDAESDGAARPDAVRSDAEADSDHDSQTAAKGPPGSIFATSAAMPARPATAAAWPRRFAIMSTTSIIGYTDLEFAVTPGKEAAGVVIPAHGFRSVHDVFARYHDAGNDPDLLRRFVEARDALGLMLTDGSGAPLDARVELISVSNPRRLVAHVAINDPRYWNAGQSPRAAGRGQSPWAGVHMPSVSSSARPRATWGSAWTSADARPLSAMTRRQAEQLRRTWGDRPCEHLSVAKEYVGAAQTGSLVCTQCGTAVQPPHVFGGETPGRPS